MRIIVKIGSSSLVDLKGRQLVGLMGSLVEDIARAVEQGHQVVLVSSGAIATGLGMLGKSERPSELPALQAASAVGQGALFSTWSEMLRLRGLHSAQVLLTMHDVSNRTTWLNARGTLEQLLDWRIIPIVNENDTTATDEITFGDNDALAAQVAVTLNADRLLLLTDTDGLFTKHPDSPNAQLIELVEDFSVLSEVSTEQKGSQWGSGGMQSKVIAAEMAGSKSIVTHIAKASTNNVVTRILSDENIGTRIAAKTKRKYSSFQLWLRYAKKVRGTILVDDGAKEAIEQRGASLLPIGIVRVSGAFEAGDSVDVASASSSDVFARGIAQYETAEIIRMINDKEHARGNGEAIHRDHLILIGGM